MDHESCVRPCNFELTKQPFEAGILIKGSRLRFGRVLRLLYVIFYTPASIRKGPSRGARLTE